MKSFHIYATVLIVGAIAISGVFFGYDAVAATGTADYQQLENIPGYEGNKTFPEYVSSVYQLALWVIGISAMFMLTVGGFMYLTSAGNTSAASSAKGVIRDALIGLALGLSAWLIVNTINPDLTTLNVSGIGSGTSVTPPPGGGAPPPSDTTPPTATTQEAAKILAGSGKLVTSGSCRDASGKQVSPSSNIAEVQAGKPMTKCFNGCGSSGAACTGSVSPSSSMLNIINAVDGNYKITSIAGGSHSANSKHYSGNAIDVTPASVALRDSFVSKGAAAYSGESGTFCEDANGNDVPSCGSSADHIHVSFP